VSANGRVRGSERAKLNTPKNPPAPVIKAPALPVPVATPSAAPARGRKPGVTISDETKARIAKTRETRGLVNDYLARVNRPASAPATGERTQARAERIAELQAELAKGTRSKPAPIFSKGPDGANVRTGTQYVEKPLKPIERAELAKEKARLEGLNAGKPRTATASLESLRTEVLAALPAFAASQGYDRAMLGFIGFSEADLAVAFPPAAPPAP